MKIVHSLWTAPWWEQEGPLRVKRGWLSPTHYWAGWIYSFWKAKESYGRVELVTDTNGAKVLVDELQLPYDKVTIALDNLPVSRSLWAYGKLIAYGLQEEPFYHVDSDAFCFKVLPEEYLKADIVIQNYESRGQGWDDNSYAGWHYVTAFPYRPGGFDKLAHERTAICMGIFGGTNIDKIREYATQVQRVVTCTENIAGWQRVASLGEARMGWMNVTVEQHFAYCFLRHHNVPIKPLVPDSLYDTPHERADELGFTHLMGRRLLGTMNDRLMIRIADEHPHAMELLWAFLGR